MLVLIFKIVVANIEIDLELDEKQNLQITYSGDETDLVTDKDREAFDIEDHKLKDAVGSCLGRRPNDAYVKSPTPWGDLYKRYKWEEVKRVLSIKSAKLKKMTKIPIIVMTEDFQNSSNRTITVNAGISHEVQNTITSSWSKDSSIAVSQAFEFGINLGVVEASETTTFSFTQSWGVSETKSKTEVVGATSGMSVELKPGEAVTVILSATEGNLEVEVEHMATLIGTVAVNYNPTYQGHHFKDVPIDQVMSSGGIKNEVITNELIQFGYYVDAKLRVYNKNTGLMRSILLK
ncbi:hypothetical protein PYW07_010777 [Mythimna separata]|uniref:Uncharacterized protein n=1 Tax=Mythimna separata TaxID=271217 RepID=A0AAD7Y7R4_MYTSE|nr:hypothetical protein PYW07_010777 [Mythimna separata]